eukprot:gene25759-31512_t
MSGGAPDLQVAWNDRTNVFSEAPPASTNGIPKTIGAVKCGGASTPPGCGKRSLYKGGGVAMEPCARGCGKMFYCGSRCAEVDWEMHKPDCDFETKGRNYRPPARMWAINSELEDGKQLLRHDRKLKGGAIKQAVQ